ncbi:hypothetical protein SBOR_2232 [Sclerotinia borealis F-4128]|uniref:2EXR domain-containing protein n=1 Tax=Sclerotinia borealis (strain F-4128) TaxID=1432307 RepID=W9CS52_SCLBF|nr:hypothetical protein SBOR_2232 [Sclerotinia borealis F-4128]
MSSFPQFALLPIELKLCVWHLALEAQEGHIVPIKQLRYGHRRRFKPHVLYFVNCDSRRTYLKFHKKNLARYPRLGTVIFDPRIDIVIVEVGWLSWIKNVLTQIRDGVEGSIMKDVRNIAISGFKEGNTTSEVLQDKNLLNSMGSMIARVLPSLKTFTYVLDYDARYGLQESLYGESDVMNHGQGLANSLQRDIARVREKLYERVVEWTRENLEEYKHSENPEWNPPMVQAKFAICGEAVNPVRNILGFDLEPRLWLV